MTTGQLHFGRPGSRRQRLQLRFEPSGLVVSQRRCRPIELSWDDYYADFKRTEPGWTVQVTGGGKASSPAVTLMIVDVQGQVQAATLTRWRALRPRLLAIPALIETLVAVPHARPALARPGVAQELIDAVASHGWTKPNPPTSFLSLNGYDLPMATVLGRHTWFIRGRLTEGTPEPDVAEIVEELLADAPDWAHVVTERHRIELRLATIRDAGRWPFGSITKPEPEPPT